jgi:hypothetical protein
MTFLMFPFYSILLLKQVEKKNFIDKDCSLIILKTYGNYQKCIRNISTKDFFENAFKINITVLKNN